MSVLSSLFNTAATYANDVVAGTVNDIKATLGAPGMK